MDFRGIAPMKMVGNLSENWKWWIQRFQTYLTATELNKKEEATQCAQLLTLIGEEGMRIYNTFEFLEQDKNKIKVLIKKFDEHFSPKKNLSFERHKFFTRRQNIYETIEQYVTELKNLSLSCELGTLRDSVVKDILICGIKDDKTREKLLETDVETLDQAVKICYNTETTKERNKLISNGKGSNEEAAMSSTDGKIRAVNASKKFHNKYNGRQAQQRNHYGRNVEIENKKCVICNSFHPKMKCPAYGKKCNKCSKMNHFASVCNSKNDGGRVSYKKINTIEQEMSIETNNCLYVGSVSHSSSNGMRNLWTEDV